MKILVTDTGYIIGQANESITFGLFENDPNYKWALDGGKGGYVIDGNIMATEVEDTIYKIYEVESIPDDYWSGKQIFVNGAFVENSNWREPEPAPPTLEERVSALEVAISDMANAITEGVNDV